MVIDLSRVVPDDLSNAAYWCRHWGVTLAQLRIAASRVGNQPGRVLADISGKSGPIDAGEFAEPASIAATDDISRAPWPIWQPAVSVQSKYLHY